MRGQVVLDTITQAVAAEAKNVLGDKLEKIILYGSYARGDFDGESDVDIMVLADVSAADARLIDNRLIKLANRLGLENDVAVSVLVKDCETFYRFIDTEPFYKNVAREGLPVNA